MPLGVVIGVLFPALSNLSRPLAEPLVLVMFSLSIYRLDPTAIRARLRRPTTIAVGIAWLLLVIPFGVFWLGNLAGLPHGLLIVLTAWSACPPLVSLPGLALLLGLDGAVALLVMIGATVLLPLSLPVVLSLLVGDGFGSDATTVAQRLLVIVVICCLAGQGIRRLVGHQRATATAASADGVLVVLMLLFAITIMGGLHQSIERAPGEILVFVVSAFLASAGLQFLAAGVFHRLARPSAAAIALASGNRNFALLLPAVGDNLSADMWLFLAIVQFPIYILPALSKPLYRLYCAKPQPPITEGQDKGP
jgi:BASS family bile acid:Na+ symporter